MRCCRRNIDLMCHLWIDRSWCIHCLLDRVLIVIDAPSCTFTMMYARTSPIMISIPSPSSMLTPSLLLMLTLFLQPYRSTNGGSFTSVGVGVVDLSTTSLSLHSSSSTSTSHRGGLPRHYGRRHDAYGLLSIRRQWVISG